MKTSIVIVIVFLALSVESANHKKPKTTMKSSKASEGDNGWPQLPVIRSFEVPPEFTEIPSIDDNDETSTPSSNKHHGMSKNKSHNH